jgi:hypothetical protein|tara:strand:+ start:2226 stop:2399 length:174 start_codon:yes stop_codon:yes gene_type:complete
MPKFTGINRVYSSGKEEDKKTTQEDRDRMMKEFLAKGGKIEKVPYKVTKDQLKRGKL